MVKTRMTSKGQITIPKQVRNRLGLQPGDEIEFIEEAGIVRIGKRLPATPFKKWEGYLQNFEGVDPDGLVEEMRGR